MRWLRLRLWWERAFWVVPLVGIILAAALADLSSELDEAIFAEPGDQLISEAAATTLLAAVGGAMVTFTGFVFSLVLLLLQFGSSQYSPRTVAFFLRARSTQVILGLFLATSLFCFLTLVGVGSEGRDNFSPSASVVIAVLLLMASMVAFIVLMHLVSKRIRIDSVVTSLGAQTRSTLVAVAARLPRPEDAVAATNGAADSGEGGRAEGAHRVRYMGRGGQVVAVDWRRLRRLAARHRMSVDVTVVVGDGLSPGRQVAWVSGATNRDRAVSRCFVVYGERSLRRDPAYGLRILVDIALKGLSPAVDDPTTASRALDEIDGVLRVASRLPLHPIQVGTEYRLTVPVMTWPDVVNLAIREIRLAGLTQPQITRRLSALLGDLAGDVSPDRAGCVIEHLEAMQDQVAATLTASEVEFAVEPDRQGIGGTRQR